VFTPVTCPLSSLFTESITVNVPPCSGAAVLVESSVSTPGWT
jgi:hypothetical protein